MGKHWVVGAEGRKNMAKSKMGDKNPSKRIDVRAKLIRNHWTKNLEVKDKIISKLKSKLKEYSSRQEVKERLIIQLKKGNITRTKNRQISQCINCNKIFYASKSWNRKFCSRSCSNSGKFNNNYNNKYQILNRLNKLEAFQKKRLVGLIKKPTLPERVLIELINKNFPNTFKYVGDGKVMIDRFNPDFISEELKCIIEVFGDYWHNLPKSKIKDNERLKTYEKYGYKTLIIWGHELVKDTRYKEIPSDKIIIDKINNFLIKNNLLNLIEIK